MEIKRDYYLNQLIERMHNGLIKVITGIRRCGKSYLLNNLFYDHLISLGVREDHIISFAFDSAEDLLKIGEDLLLMEKENKRADPEKFVRFISSQIEGEGEYYLLLDEIQELDCFEAVLNGYLRKRNLDIYVTGSNANLLSKDVSTKFAGRGDEVKLYPCNFREFLSASGGEKDKALREYMLYGGIPSVILAKDAKSKEKTLLNLYDEIYIKDIKKRNKVRNTQQLEDLLNVLSSSIGSLTNPKKLANTFHSKSGSRIKSETICKYLRYLEDAFLLEEAIRYDIKGKAYIETPKKYYFEDLGLRNAKIGFRQAEPTHLMENLIFNELMLRGYQVDVGAVPVRESKDKNASRTYLEVDFVASLGGEKVYIQSAYSLLDPDKEYREKRPFLSIDDSFKKVVITNDMVVSPFDDLGYISINIFDFLLNEKAF